VKGTGIWAIELRYGEPGEIARSAAELESLGYDTLWIPDIGGPVLDAVDVLLDATSTVTVATGILNIWKHEPAEVTAWWSGLAPDRRARVLLGLGVSHGPLIGEAWGRPLATMNAYLDALGEDGPPREHLCLAALGPKMLDLARRRTSGALPYLVTPGHTALAREALGDATLHVEQGVVLETDPEVARAIARAGIEHYFAMPNYVNNWKRLGFTDDDIDSRSDRLIDALIAWGDPDAIRSRVDAHRRAGADHVCLQVITPAGAGSPMAAWRSLAPA